LQQFGHQGVGARLVRRVTVLGEALVQRFGEVVAVAVGMQAQVGGQRALDGQRVVVDRAVHITKEEVGDADVAVGVDQHLGLYLGSLRLCKEALREHERLRTVLAVHMRQHEVQQGGEHLPAVTDLLKPKQSALSPLHRLPMIAAQSPVLAPCIVDHRLVAQGHRLTLCQAVHSL
jgi:hypothetical protein